MSTPQTPTTATPTTRTPTAQAPACPPRAASDLQQVVGALRTQERFLVTTHENPDGDALGSLLASHLLLGLLGKESVMFLTEPATVPGAYGFVPLDRLTLDSPAGASAH